MNIKTILNQSASPAGLLFSSGVRNSEAEQKRMEMIAALSTARVATRNDKRRLGISTNKAD